MRFCPWLPVEKSWIQIIGREEPVVLAVPRFSHSGPRKCKKHEAGPPLFVCQLYFRLQKR